MFFQQKFINYIHSLFITFFVSKENASCNFGASAILGALIYYLLTTLAFGIAMVCNIAWNIIVASVRRETPINLQGRVLGFSRVLTRLAMPLGALV